MILMSGSGGRGLRGRGLVRKYARRRKRRRERKKKNSQQPDTRHPTPWPPQPGGRETLFLDHGVALPWQNFNKYGLKKSNPFSDNHWTLGTSGTRYNFFFGVWGGGVCRQNQVFYLFWRVVTICYVFYMVFQVQLPFPKDPLLCFFSNEKVILYFPFSLTWIAYQLQSSASILILQFVIYTGSYIYILTDRLDFHLPLSYPLPYPLTSKGSGIQRKKII